MLEPEPLFVNPKIFRWAARAVAMAIATTSATATAAATTTATASRPEVEVIQPGTIALASQVQPRVSVAALSSRKPGEPWVSSRVHSRRFPFSSSSLLDPGIGTDWAPYRPWTRAPTTCLAVPVKVSRLSPPRRPNHTAELGEKPSLAMASHRPSRLPSHTLLLLRPK